jgi:hypothetical protein
VADRGQRRERLRGLWRNLTPAQRQAILGTLDGITLPADLPPVVLRILRRLHLADSRGQLTKTGQLLMRQHLDQPVDQPVQEGP